jgi:hypothetical protein
MLMDDYVEFPILLGALLQLLLLAHMGGKQCVAIPRAVRYASQPASTDADHRAE